MPKAALKEPTLNPKVAPLATPTDLDRQATASIAKALNTLVADAFALYLKTKNFHWHLSGPHFRDYHLMLDEQSSQIFATIDPLAERVRKLGERTVLGLSHVESLATIKDDQEDFVAPDRMLKILLQDNKKMAASMRKAHSLCDDNGDSGSSGLLEIYIDETERRTWFLFEASRGLEPSSNSADI